MTNQLTTTPTTEFTEFPKIARLSREVIITEKLDGTNAQIYIEALDGHEATDAIYQACGLAMWAGSRSRWITPQQDNYGFARWAYEHREELIQLGPGRHFGEWWGSGIQRGYNLPKGEKRFSLFNVSRWCEHGKEPKLLPTANPTIDKRQDILPACCHLVPELYRGTFDTMDVEYQLDLLRENGSAASPGFLRPEGIICFHVAANIGFKKTLDKDELPKSFHANKPVA